MHRKLGTTSDPTTKILAKWVLTAKKSQKTWSPSGSVGKKHLLDVKLSSIVKYKWGVSTLQPRGPVMLLSHCSIVQGWQNRTFWTLNKWHELEIFLFVSSTSNNNNQFSILTKSPITSWGFSGLHARCRAECCENAELWSFLTCTPV